jgi:hypothetical protein
MFRRLMKRLSIAVLMSTLAVACSGTGSSTTQVGAKIGQNTGSAGSSGAAGEDTNGAFPSASGGTSGEGATAAAGSGDTTGVAGTGAAGSGDTTGAAGAATGAAGTGDTTGSAGAVAAAGSPGTTNTTGAAGAPSTTGAASAPSTTGAAGAPGTTGAAGAANATGGAGTVPTAPVATTGAAGTGAPAAAGSPGTTTTGSAGSVAMTGTGSAGTTGAAGTGAAGTGSSGTGTAGTGVVPPPATTPPPRGVNLCAGLIADKLPHPMTPIARPAVGQTVTDHEFGTTIRRITEVPATNLPNPALRPLYSTVSAWNADETMLILYSAGHGHQLYDGKTYQFIRALNDIHPADLEQVYWSTTDPDIFFYVDHNKFVRYHVREAQPEVMTTFSFCGDPSKTDTRASGGTDPFFTSFDSRYIGLGCQGTSFIYDIANNAVISKRAAPGENPIQASPSGKLGWFDSSGTVTDNLLNPLRKLDMKNPSEHSTMGLSPSGVDTWYGVVFDPGPKGNNDIGSLVAFDMTTGQSKVFIGPKTGYPYPPTTHISAMAYRDPGFIVTSTLGDLTGKGLLDIEVAVTNTADGTVCRVGRHRSWGKKNTHLQQPYWAEAHAVPSPSGTRILFASDWGDNPTVDSYVIELPSYKK